MRNKKLITILFLLIALFANAQVITANLGNGVNLALTDRGVWRYTGASISIPANSIYKINLKMLVEGEDVSSSDQSAIWMFVKSGFSSSSGNYSRPTDIEGGEISAVVSGASKYSVLSGSAIIRNTKNTALTLYYWGTSMGGYRNNGSVIAFGSKNHGENVIYATPIY